MDQDNEARKMIDRKQTPQGIHMEKAKLMQQGIEAALAIRPTLFKVDMSNTKDTTKKATKKALQESPPQATWWQYLLRGSSPT